MTERHNHEAYATGDDDHGLYEKAQHFYSIDDVDWGAAERAQYPEKHPLAWIESELKEKVIGQSAAIESVVRALVGEKLRNPQRPIATLLFLGPTGVGKTETANELASILHESRDRGDESEEAPAPFLRIDCSEYHSDHTVARLIGSPPGYVGYGDTPQLDKKVIEQHKSVILFDEIEKGAPKLHDMLLQIIDNGEVTTGDSKKISFRDSIIIMTSNVGSKDMMRMLGRSGQIGFQSESTDTPQQDIEKAAMHALRDIFRPEFIGRIKEKVVFNPLEDEQIEQILEKYVHTINDNYFSETGITLTLSDALRQHLVATTEERFELGARPVLHQYDRMVGSLLGEYVGSGAIPEDSFVRADLFTDEDGKQTVGFLHVPDAIYASVPEEKEQQEAESLQLSGVLVPLGAMASREVVKYDAYREVAERNRKLISIFRAHDQGDLYAI